MPLQPSPVIPPVPPIPMQGLEQLEQLSQLQALQKLGNNQYSPVQAQRSLSAVKAARSELRSQLSRLEDRRDDLAREITRDIQNNDGQLNASRTGLEARIADLDVRIKELDQQLAQADQAVAVASAVPGAVVETPPPVRTGPPDEIIAIPIVFTLFVLFPLTIAWSRRIWRRGKTIIAPVPAEITDKLDQMATAVESMALEVERIGEGQRFITKVMSDDPRALGAGAMPHIPVARAAEHAEVRRGDQGDWR